MSHARRVLLQHAESFLERRRPRLALDAVLDLVQHRLEHRERDTCRRVQGRDIGYALREVLAVELDGHELAAEVVEAVVVAHLLDDVAVHAEVQLVALVHDFAQPLQLVRRQERFHGVLQHAGRFLQQREGHLPFTLRGVQQRFLLLHGRALGRRIVAHPALELRPEPVVEALLLGGLGLLRVRVPRSELLPQVGELAVLLFKLAVLVEGRKPARLLLRARRRHADRLPAARDDEVKAVRSLVLVLLLGDAVRVHYVERCARTRRRAAVVGAGEDA